MRTQCYQLPATVHFINRVQDLANCYNSRCYCTLIESGTSSPLDEERSVLGVPQIRNTIPPKHIINTECKGGMFLWMNKVQILITHMSYPMLWFNGQTCQPCTSLSGQSNYPWTQFLYYHWEAYSDGHAQTQNLSLEKAQTSTVPIMLETVKSFICGKKLSDYILLFFQRQKGAWNRLTELFIS